MQLKHLARALNISPSMCSRLAKRGMPVDSLERAQRWRRRHLELARTKGARMSAGEAASALREAGEGLDADAIDSPLADDSAEYRQARAERERLRAERERIELERLKGNLLDAREVADFEFTSARILRDAMENVAPRFAAEIHALILSLIPEEQRAAVGQAFDSHVVEQRMADVIRGGLSDAATMIRAADKDDDDDDE